MTAQELLALADRVEQARGADRELGREILMRCGFGYVSPLQQWMNPTASFDAAAKLIPADHDSEIQIDRIGRTWAWVGPLARSEAASPALALTAAAIRARAALLPAAPAPVARLPQSGALGAGAGSTDEVA